MGEAHRRLEDFADQVGRLGIEAEALETGRDQRVVVRPDRAVVVAHRVEERLEAAERAQPPPAIDVLSPEALSGGPAFIAGQQSGPETVAGVGADDLDRPFFCIERERIEAAIAETKVPHKATLELGGERLLACSTLWLAEPAQTL